MADDFTGVSSPAPETGGDVSPAFTPESNYQEPQGEQSEQVGGAATPAFEVPPDNSDLDGQLHLQHVQSLIQTRDAYNQLNQDYQAFREQIQPYADVYNQLEQVGGLDTAHQAIDLMSGLFTPELDANGIPVIDPVSGLPVTNTQGFVNNLAQMNWSTVTDLTSKLLELPAANGESLLAHVVREVLGLDPSKIGLYQQINTSADAAQMGLIDVDPIELEDIPPNLHETYFRLNQNERRMVQEIVSDESRNQMLETLRQRQGYEDFMKSQRQSMAEQQEARQQAFAQAVEARGEEAAVGLWNSHASAIAEEIGRIQWSTDPQRNAQVHNLLLGAANTYVQFEPTIQPLLRHANMLVRQAARLEARGDVLEANRARIASARLGQQIAGRARQFVLQSVETLQSFNGMASSRGDGRVRPVIGARGQGGVEGNGQKWQMPEGMRFGSSEHIDALEAYLGRR